MTNNHQQRLYVRTLKVVVISQMFGGLGLAAGITVGALLAQQIWGTDSFSGVPVALLTLGAAASALLVGRISQRYGRRIGLSAGFMLGGIGAIGVLIAAITNSIVLLLVSFLLYGAGTSTNLQARYAATDLADASKRARAVSFAMVMTTFGAVAGPNLVNVTGQAASSMGIPTLAGPFGLGAVAFMIAGLVLFVFLRPDPLLTAQAIAKLRKPDEQLGSVKQGGNRVTKYDGVPQHQRRGIVLGSSVMVLTQIIMIAIMTMTPIHMKHHGHDLGSVGLVISIHVGAMFLPSLITGYLVDKFGRIFMSIASIIVLVSSGVLAAFAPADSMLTLTIALALLGLGWNFGLISGTTLIVDATTPSNRAKIQGSVDVLISLVGASSGALSGVVVAQTSYMTLSLAGGLLSLLLIPIIVWSRKYSRSKSYTISE